LGNDERDESENKNIENIDNHKLDEIMNDVTTDFVDILSIFENLGNDSNILLVLGCQNL
jgi:hypothetical protein